MAFSTFEIKICGQKLCSQKDGFAISVTYSCRLGHFIQVIKINWIEQKTYRLATWFVNLKSAVYEEKSTILLSVLHSYYVSEM